MEANIQRGFAMNVLITGAASGIGYAAAQYFAAQGHTVYGVDMRPVPEGKNISNGSEHQAVGRIIMPVMKSLTV